MFNDDDEMEFPDGSQLLFDGNRGVYIPQNFAEEIKRDCVSHVSAEQWTVLEGGPDQECYWDVWDEVENNAVITDPVTKVNYILYQDGDVWLIPKED